MQVFNYSDNASATYVNNSVPSTAQRLDTRNPLDYGLAHFDGIGAFHLAHAYVDRQSHVGDMLKVLSTTGTGARILADLKALSAQGVRIAIGPRDDQNWDAHRISLDGVSTTADGQALWDCYFRRKSTATEFDADGYRMLIGELTQVRNLAAGMGWPGVPALRLKDVESAFMAELALRTAPAMSQSGYVPTFPAPPHEFDAAYMPDWGRGPIRFDTLSGLMPAWFTGAADGKWREVRAVLATIQKTAIGQRLLSDLWVYGRSRAVMLIHCSSSGKNGVRTLDDKTPIWSFDKATLVRQARSKALTDGEAQASGAFRNLLAAHAVLASKLGMLGKAVDGAAMQDLFEQQLIGERARAVNAQAGEIPPRVLRPAVSPSSGVEAARAARSPVMAHIPPVSRASSPVASGGSPQGHPTEPTIPLSNAWAQPSVQVEAAALVGGGPDTGASGQRSRQNNGVAGWLQNSARAFARSFNRSFSVPRDPNARHRIQNPYADSATRPSGI